jgi:hypothetical protein
MRSIPPACGMPCSTALKKSSSNPYPWRQAAEGASIRFSSCVPAVLAPSRCSRTVEIQKVDAIRLYGQHAIWKDVGQRLLNDTCRQRTGRHEEDGCWPFYGAQ